MMWDAWKKGFDTWELHTAQYLERWLESAAVLRPAGRVLSTAMRAKAQHDRALAQWWGLWGLPTRADQERALHALNQLQSRLIDLEDKLLEIEAGRPDAPPRS